MGMTPWSPPLSRPPQRGIGETIPSPRMTHARTLIRPCVGIPHLPLRTRLGDQIRYFDARGNALDRIDAIRQLGQGKEVYWEAWRVWP